MDHSRREREDFANIQNHADRLASLCRCCLLPNLATIAASTDFQCQYIIAADGRHGPCPSRRRTAVVEAHPRPQWQLHQWNLESTGIVALELQSSLLRVCGTARWSPDRRRWRIQLRECCLDYPRSDLRSVGQYMDRRQSSERLG